MQITDITALALPLVIRWLNLSRVILRGAIISPSFISLFFGGLKIARSAGIKVISMIRALNMPRAVKIPKFLMLIVSNVKSERNDAAAISPAVIITIPIRLVLSITASLLSPMIAYSS